MDSILKIDLDVIIENIKRYKSELLPNQKFCAVAKADCYSLGARKICWAINDYVDYFAVASRKEFFAINKLVTKPILLLTPIYKSITILAKRNCEFCVSNLKEFLIFERLAKRNKNVLYKIHIAINTGMNRFGFCGISEIEIILNHIQKTQNIVICGVFSHFYAGNCKILVENQIKKLEKFRKYLLSKIDCDNIVFHISNTSGFEFCDKFDMVRIGLGMFLNNNKSCFSLSAKVLEIQKLKAGETAGYGLKFLAEKNMKIAVVSIGYADGISKSVAGKGFVLIKGTRCKILAVCMDVIIVDVLGVDAKIQDEVVLIGVSEHEQIFVCEMASWCDTIEHEIMTRLSRRIKRVFIGGSLGCK